MLADNFLAMRRGLVCAVVLACLFVAAGDARAEGIVEFFDGLYKKHKTLLVEKARPGFEEFCKENGLDPKNTGNAEKYFRLLFFHHLFTGSGASDCASGGAFKIPYFWHWRTPNVRHEIAGLPGGKLLVKQKPPAGRYGRYQTLADIDRFPSKFLADLVADSPGYKHPECGDFFTFGWCSEREMSFSLLMSSFDYKSLIFQNGIHVESRFWIEFVDAAGQKKPVILSVDNTMGYFTAEAKPPVSFDTWYASDAGGPDGKQANVNARSKNERALVKKIVVSPKAAARLSRLAEDYFKNFEHQKEQKKNSLDVLKDLKDLKLTQ